MNKNKNYANLEKRVKELEKRLTVIEVPVQEQSKHNHSLKIKDKTIKLDDFEVRGVTSYELKDQAKGLKELTLKISIKQSDVSID